jgi:hypothetical protein
MSTKHRTGSKLSFSKGILDSHFCCRRQQSKNQRLRSIPGAPRAIAQLLGTASILAAVLDMKCAGDRTGDAPMICASGFRHD